MRAEFEQEIAPGVYRQIIEIDGKYYPHKFSINSGNVTPIDFWNRTGSGPLTEEGIKSLSPEFDSLKKAKNWMNSNPWNTWEERIQYETDL